MSDRPGVHVTLETIYWVLLETKDVVTKVQEGLHDLEKDSQDHEDRIRELEKHRISVKQFIAGVAAAGMGGASLVELTRILGT